MTGVSLMEGGRTSSGGAGSASSGAEFAGTGIRWVDICGFAELLPERGACALVDGRQVAIFRTHDDELFALSNRDPFSGAYVLARGILGTRRGVPTIASPMYKQAFDLRTGHCLDDAGRSVPTFRIRRVRTESGERVEVALP
jgi:nitrite reductase (NADH) small subunit